MPTTAGARAILRRSGDRYVVEVFGTGALTPRGYYSLVAALNADPALRLRWRPLSDAERASVEHGPGALYVVPA